MTPKSLFISLLVGGMVLAQGSKAQIANRMDINPALSYYQAFLLAPDIAEADMDYLANHNLWSRTLPEHFGELVRRYDPEFKILRQAARSTAACDWGLDLSEGPATLLPHLARCKAAMVGARYRVAWALQQNRPQDAQADLLAAFSLARNISRDGTLISVLVQIAAEAIGSNIIAENYGNFSARAFEQIIQGIDAAPAQGTVAESIAFEKATFPVWLVKKIQELQKTNADESKVMEGIRDLIFGLGPGEQGESAQFQSKLWEQLATAGGHTSDGILRVLNEESKCYDRLSTIMALPYSEFDAAARQFADELKHSQYPLLSESFPALVKARQREFKIQVWLAMLHTALAYRLHGDPGLLSVNDPCGQGPFAFERFVFQGVDRGFQLKSRFEGSGFPEILIFVERAGDPFLLDGPHVGEARLRPQNQK